MVKNDLFHLIINLPHRKTKLLLINGLIAIGLLITTQSLLFATTLTFNEYTTFSQATTGNLRLESFENLTADNQAYQHQQLALADFILYDTQLETRLSIYDKNSSGQHAVDGNNYLKNSLGKSLSFMFLEPITAFGLHIIDWGESGQGEIYFAADFLNTPITIATTPLADGEEFFFGISTAEPFTEFDIFHNLSRESWAIDAIYSQNNSNMLNVTTPSSFILFIALSFVLTAFTVILPAFKKRLDSIDDFNICHQ